MSKASKSFASLRKRSTKAARRTKRVATLSRINPKARNLFNTGCLPQAAVGSALLGLNRELQAKIDNMALQAQ